MVRALAPAAILAVAALVMSGCAEPAATAQAAPTTSTAMASSATVAPLGQSPQPAWAPGQHWTWNITFSMTATGSGQDEAVEDSFEGTLRLDALTGPVLEGGRVLALERLDSDEAHSYARLVGIDLATFSYAYGTPIPNACVDADTCDPSAIAFDEPGLGYLRFPLAAGKTWDLEVEEGLTLKATVVGEEALAVNGTSLQAHKLRITGSASESNPIVTAKATIVEDLTYVPALAHIGSDALSTDVVVDVRGPEPEHQELHGRGTLRLLEAGQGAPMPLPEAFALAAGTIIEAVDPGTVRLVEHPERFEAGESWTFTALGATDPEALAWFLVRNAPDGSVKLLQQATGPTFPVAFEEPGQLLVAVVLTDASGEVVAEDGGALYVDATYTATAVCGPGASVPAAPSDEACAPFEVELPPGAFHVLGTATYPQGQSMLPCGALALLADGTEVARSAAWPEGEAAVEAIAIVDEDQPWTIVWSPSLSVGGEVAYELKVAALKDPKQAAEPVACEAAAP